MKKLKTATLWTSTGYNFDATGKKRSKNTLIRWAHGDEIIPMPLEEVGRYPDLAMSMAANRQFDKE